MDGKTYVKTGHVPQYVELELSDYYKDTIEVERNKIKVNMLYWKDPYSEPIEEVLEVDYFETDDGLIINGGTYIDYLFKDQLNKRVIDATTEK